MKKIDSLNEDMYTNDVFQILLDYEIARSKRYPSPLTLLQIEMTPSAFSAEALSAAPGIFSSALNAHLRSVDIPSKTGNIFMLLLPNSDKHAAQAVCERLLSVFRNKFETPREIPLYSHFISEQPPMMGQPSPVKASFKKQMKR